MTRTRLLAIALFISLALNVFIGGLVIGWGAHGHWRGGWMGGWDGPRIGFGMRMVERHGPDKIGAKAKRWLKRVVGDGGEDAVDAVWEERKDRIVPLTRGVRLARREVSQTLKREPYDAEAYRTSLRGLENAMGAVVMEVHDAMADLLDRLEPEPRRRLAEKIWYGRRHHFDDD